MNSVRLIVVAVALAGCMIVGAADAYASPVKLDRAATAVVAPAKVASVVKSDASSNEDRANFLPEPGLLTLFGVGLLGLGRTLGRRKV